MNDRLPLFLAAAFALLAVAPAASAQSHCKKGEVVYFSCTTKSAGKVVSLCGGPLNGMGPERENEDGWLQYRFGRPGKPEFVYPNQKAGSWRQFEGEYQQPHQTSYYGLSFTNKQFTYTVAQREAATPFYGVQVYTKERTVQIPCVTPPGARATAANSVAGDEFQSLVLVLEPVEKK
jgi:hypothetical protein